MKQLCSLIGACVSAALLTACGSGNLAASGPPISRQTSTTSSCLTAPCIYTAQATYSKSKIGVFTGDATGNVAPVEPITGKRTQLYLVRGGVAVGVDHKVFASDDGTVTVYAAGAYGNAKPIQTISGSNTGLNESRKLTVDAQDDIYVANSANGSGPASITVYSAGATGNATPVQTITGSLTNLDSTYSVAVDSSHDIYATNLGSSPSVTVFAAGANGNVAPVQTISGSSTTISSPLGIALDASKNIYVCDNGAGSITVFAPNANGNVPPIRTISGSKTKINNPWGVALDSGGNIYVTSTGSILVFAAGANGNVRPTRIIKGSLTKLNSMQQFALAVQ
ncbi:MAG TPA: hypothetical protein VFE16_05355 [Candidatus Cybelea sp.]|nr:hypothetical protein [Candidatus Cybelea sp.]